MHIRCLRVDVIAQVVELAAVRVRLCQAIVRQSDFLQVLLRPGRNARGQDEVMIAEVHQEGFRTSRQWQRLTVRCQVAFFDRIFASNDGCCLDIAFQFGTRPMITKESPISDAWKRLMMSTHKGDVILQKFSPTGFFSSLGQPA